MNTYPLDKNVSSPFCRGYWDKNTGKFFEINSADVIQCCINSCNDDTDSCFKNCKESDSNCSNRCLEFIHSCENSCVETHSDGMKIINNCSFQNNCGKYPDMNLDCIEKEKENIINCCKRDCVSNQSYDCSDDFCDDFYMHFDKNLQKNVKENLSKNVQVNLGNSENSGNLGNFGTKMNNISYIWIIILFFIIFSVFIILKIITRK